MSDAASDPRITDSKPVERELQASEERFRLATEAAGMFAWEGDLATGAALWSANAAAVIGCRPEDLPCELSQSHFFIAPEDTNRVIGDYTRAMASRRDTYSTEYRGSCELSSAKFFRSDTRILYNTDGAPVRILGVTQDITDRRIAEEALRESEDRFRRTFENAEVGMAHVALDGQWLRVNHRLCEITGFTHEELRTKTFGDLTHPEDLEADWAQARRLLAGEITTFSMDKRYIRKNGSIVWVALTSSLARRPDGEPDYFIGVIRDITVRRQAEEALRESEARLRVLGDHIPGGFLYQLLVPADGSPRFTYLSAGVEEIFGMTAAQVMADPAAFWGLIAEEDFPRFMAAQKFSMRHLAPFDCEFRQGSTSGELRWIHCRSKPRRLADGSVLWDGVAVDISAHKNAEAALEERERFTRRVLDNLFAFVGVTTPDGTAVEVNRAPLEAAGIQASDVLGLKLWDTFWFAGVPERAAKVRDASERAARGEVVRYDEAVRMAGDSLMWIDFQIAPLRDDTGRITHLIPSGMDISARHDAEARLAASLRELREAQDELVRKERLATLGQLAGGVAHELRTPLSVMRNSVYYLEHVLPQGDPTIRDILGEMQRAVVGSDHIIGEMLDFVREPSHETRVFPIGLAITRALQLAPPPQTILFDGPFGETGAEVRANQDQVTRILINLIQNAIQAMSHCGGLEIMVNRVEGAKVCISVKDTGCGIPPENLDKIFDALFTTKTRGIGLGLAISLRYARLNQGTLLVESKVGSGTTFRLTLEAANRG